MKQLFFILVSIFFCSLNSEVLLLKNGSVLLGDELERYDNYDLLIEDGYILEVGENLQQNTEIEIDEIISIEDKLITPGFITPFSQLGLLEIDMIPETRDDRSSLYSAGFSIAHTFNPSSTLIPHNLNGGITSTISAPGSRGLFKGMASFFSLSGSRDSLIHQDIAMVASLTNGQESKSANIQLIEDSISLASLFDKDMKLNLKNYLPEGVELSRRDLIALKRVANKEIPLVIRADRASDIIALINLSERISINLILMGVSEGWLVADEISRANIPVILEPKNNLPSSFDRLGSKLENASLLSDAGVKILFKSDNYDSHNAYLSRQGAGIAVAYGLDWTEAIKALTINVAEAFDLIKIGSIEKGYRADLILWNSDPLEVTSYPSEIYVGGKRVSNSTRSKKLRDRYLELNEF